MNRLSNTAKGWLQLLHGCMSATAHIQISEAIDLLATYEDTGLTPAEISAMQAENTTVKKKESATSKLFDDFNDSIINTWRDKYRELLSSAKDLQKENATLKKALELACDECSFHEHPYDEYMQKARETNA